MPVVRELKIINEKGMHARAAAKFARIVESHDSKVKVERDGLSADGDSIMSLLMLAASKGTSISVTLEGPDAERLAGALSDLVESRFGEDF